MAERIHAVEEAASRPPHPPAGARPGHRGGVVGQGSVVLDGPGRGRPRRRRAGAGGLRAHHEVGGRPGPAGLAHRGGHRGGGGGPRGGRPAAPGRRRRGPAGHLTLSATVASPSFYGWPGMFPYSEERFTADEETILRRYVTNLDQPVFALVNLPEVVKGALFARYSRSPKSLRRLFLDEFVGDLDVSGDADGRRHGRAGACRAALREGLRRVRRRLGGAAGRRPPRLRAVVQRAVEGARVGPPHGLPRAVDPLHRVQPTPRQRAVPLLPAARDPRLPARGPLRRRDGPGVRHLRRAAAAHAGLGGRALPPAGGRQRLRVPPGDPRQVARRVARAPAGGVAVQHRHVRHRPVLRAVAAAHACAPAARGAPLRRHDARRAAQGDPVVPATRRRPRTRRRMVGLPGLDPRAHVAACVARLWPELGPADPARGRDGRGR